ncbi:MAG: CDP-6-deoxy-delta-3,4-glucoseen reductase [Gammaproteobacteria bacterium]|nr:CDP-6-deoxy-delta-3,4-glucoseen reductase [Gammaproteobacteria bacterium]
MSYKVKIMPSGHVFEVETEETVLDAGLRQGITLAYGCRGGACGACKAKVLAGEVDYDGREPIALGSFEKEQNMALFCIAKAKSDLVIQGQEIELTSELEKKILPCRVEKMEKLASDVMGIWLKIPSTQRLAFFAGQYIDILLSDGRRRSFSLANAPHDDELLELHIRYIDGGEFTHQVFGGMKEKTMLRFEGPLGQFTIRENSTRDMIFMAGGTGFAPIKGMIDHLFSEKCQRKMTLYWGVRHEDSLYMQDLISQWQADHENFTYVPVLSEPLPESGWQGRTGLVHQAILDDYPDLSDYDVYAGGSPLMVEAGFEAFSQQGLSGEHYFSDAFTFANDKKKSE